MTLRDKKRKGLYLILVVFFAAFLSLSVYYLHTPIDLTSYKSILLPEVEKAAHLNIELESLGLTILPYPRLSLGGLTIKEGEYAVLKAESVKASLALVPLIFRKEFEVKNLVITGSELFIKREADGGLNVIRILKETFVPVSIKKVRIKAGRAHFTDDFLQGAIRYEANDINATLIPEGADDFSYSGSIKILPYAGIKFSGKTKNSMRDFEGAADIKGLNIEQMRPYLSGIIPGERLEGNIDASLHYQILEKPVSAQSGASGAAATFKQISVKGNAAYAKLTASMPSLFDRPISSSQGNFDIDIASDSDALTIAIPKAQLYFHDFITFADLKFESKKNNNDKLVLNLNTTRIPLVSIKEQFFISILPEGLKKQIALTSFLSGQMKIFKLTLAGSIRDIKLPDYYKNRGSLLAVIEVQDAGFAHKELKRGFSMVNGLAKWEDGDVNFYGMSGNYGRSVVEKLDGGAVGMLGTPLLQLNGHCTVDAKEAMDELRKWLDEKSQLEEAIKGIDADGMLPLSFRLSGKMDEHSGLPEKGLALSVAADAVSVNFTSLPWVKKEKGFKTAIDVDLSVKRDGVSIQTARIKFGSSEFGIKGLLNFNQGMSYKLNISASAMKLDDIDMIVSYLKKELPSKGNLSLNLDMAKEDARKFPNIKGAISLQGGEFETGFLPKRVSVANLTATFYGDSAVIIVDGMKTGNSFLSGSIAIPDIKNADVDFNFDSPYLDYEDVYSSKAFDAEGGKLEDIPITGKGKVSAKETLIAGFHVKSFRADVLLKPDSVLLKAAFAKDKGKAVNNFVYSKDKETSYVWKFSIDASGVGLEPLLKEIGAREKILTGETDIKMELSARRGQGELAKRIDGKADIYSKDGRLWKFVVLSKIFSIVNIISIDELFREGLPYKTVSGNFSIKNGGISTDNLLLDSNSMRMSAIGKIDAADMAIDAKLGLHPFVTIDKIITNIPLAGWIIGGKEKSTISMYYTIKGPLRDPNVEAIPIQALGEGVWGIFKRTLKLPLDIVEPLVE